MNVWQEPGAPCMYCGAARSCAHRETKPAPEIQYRQHNREVGQRRENQWSPEEESTLMGLWGEPEMSASKIAEMIPGRTRNAVIGMARRLALRAPPASTRPARMTRAQAEQGLVDYEAKYGKKNTRKAYKALGDDVTFSRFVKTGRRPADVKKLLHSPRVVDPKKLRNPAIAAGRSIFHEKGVKPVADLNNLLVSGHSNIKIGRDVRKGKLFRGYWIYTLSLEERATCPRSCHHWATCYGNGMPYAKRVSHENPAALMRKLEKEIAELRKKHVGVLIRLHALGDFFSPEYVDFWVTMLLLHKNLAVFGYTAREPKSDIGTSIRDAKDLYGPRFAIRWSNGGGATDCTVPISVVQERPANAFICPEQLGLSDGCGKCGLCWNTTRNVAFLEH